VTIPTPNNPYARPGPEKCFRCNQLGHKSNQCPKRQMISLIEAGGEVEDGEDVEAGDDMLGYEATEAFVDEGVLLSQSLVIQRVLLVPGQESQAQRHNIFRTCCIVNQRVCDVIIDGGNGENIVSKAMVSKLGLTTKRHLELYKISWIK
jgi:hypothetical protein